MTDEKFDRMKKIALAGLIWLIYFMGCATVDWFYCVYAVFIQQVPANSLMFHFGWQIILSALSLFGYYTWLFADRAVWIEKIHRNIFD